MTRSGLVSALCAALLVCPALAAQQTPRPAAPTARPASPPPNLPVGVPTPPGYVIGPNDVLTVFFWREKELSGDVSVRPDGKISLQLLNEIDAAGLTPDALRETITKAASRYIEDPSVTVVVKQINSRKVFITGQVGKPGAYDLVAPTTVMQFIALAGGLHEFADKDDIVILRTEKGKQVALRFNYKDVVKRKNLQQNIELKPGDTIIVP
jgi:polysaccharide export outer membrane protein